MKFERCIKSFELYKLINGLKNLVLAELGSKCQTVICILIAVKNNFIICNSKLC